MKTIGQRLRHIREKQLNLSREKFVERLAITPKTLERYENNETSPDANFLTRMWARYHKEMNMADFEWLLTGKRVEYAATAKTPVLGKVPAGFPEDVASEDIIEYISLPDAPKDSYALIVDGNSMAPDIKSGDYVIFLPAEKSDIRYGDIIVVNDEFGQAMIKRFVLKEDEPYLKSDNPEYPSFKPNENYRIVGRVIDVWSRKKIRR